ncbi:hypothetical protein K435DRAFT_799426 [Dendrothele bispora CBS 962.96]|uniref:Uncharacterized protein n=1 Tax=Dendrothele bispora (strain CBS 962.96) TaxID=1314807 RepID=A0A4S8LVV6_DENBC|nr:hypothetical protein K435DRAFT_799426 [Dendrothele bispora CBS 962.96]
MEGRVRSKVRERGTNEKGEERRDCVMVVYSMGKLLVKVETMLIQNFRHLFFRRGSIPRTRTVKQTSLVIAECCYVAVKTEEFSIHIKSVGQEASHVGERETLLDHLVDYADVSERHYRRIWVDLVFWFLSLREVRGEASEVNSVKDL